MRISDWSSDVCSSDVPARAPCGHLAGMTISERATEMCEGCRLDPKVTTEVVACAGAITLPRRNGDGRQQVAEDACDLRRLAGELQAAQGGAGAPPGGQRRRP